MGNSVKNYQRLRDVICGRPLCKMFKRDFNIIHPWKKVSKRLKTEFVEWCFTELSFFSFNWVLLTYYSKMSYTINLPSTLSTFREIIQKIRLIYLFRRLTVYHTFPMSRLVFPAFRVIFFGGGRGKLKSFWIRQHFKGQLGH